MVPVGPRSLTVTALSTGEGCFASSWLKFQLSGPPAALDHSGGNFRLRMGKIVRHCVGKSCPALSSELGPMLPTGQVVRGSDGLVFRLLTRGSGSSVTFRRFDESFRFQI